MMVETVHIFSDLINDEKRREEIEKTKTINNTVLKPKLNPILLPHSRRLFS